MVIVRLIGGLGSQMSSYAYAKTLASRGYEVKIDITAFNSYKLFSSLNISFGICVTLFSLKINFLNLVNLKIILGISV